MKKKTNKIIALILAVILSFSALPFTAFAGSIASISSDKAVGIDNAQNAKTEYSDTQIDAGNISTDVYLTVDDSDIIVSVPTSVVIGGVPDSNGNYTGSYTVSASGDMAADKLVQIKPNDKEIELKQSGKLSKAAIITQERTVFDSDDLKDNIKSPGTINANGLTAGSWKAETSFELKITSRNDYDAIPSGKLLAENKDMKTYEEYGLFELGRLTPSVIEVTNNVNNDIITPKLLYLPYGSAVRFDNVALKEMGYTGSFYPDIRMYQYNEDGTYIKEITYKELAPSEDNVNNNFLPSNFVVTDKDGMYVRFRWVKWNNTFNENTKKDLQSVFSVHSLTAVNAEIFDNTTLTKCWENTDIYEAWATKCMFLNPADNLYYAFYASQPSHTDYKGKILYRTSSDLIKWSEPTVIWDSTTDEFITSMDGAVLCDNGDVIISMLCDTTGENRYTKTRFLRSTDGCKTWTVEHFMLDGKDADGLYRIQRARVLDDGRMFTGYFDCGKTEKAGICYSEDNGHTWISSDFSSKASLSDNGEYDFVILNNGNILCAQRQNVDGIGISVTISTDNGKSFINETSLHFVDNNTQMINCPFIRYDKENDRLTIYEVDRFKTGGLVGIYTSGSNITDFLLNGAEFKGFFANACSLGINGNADMGYPHIIDAPDGTVKCFYYNRTNQEANTASWYSVSTN